MKRREFINATLAGGAALSMWNATWSAAAGDIPAVRLSGAATVIEKAALAELAGRLAGTLILPTHPDYEKARRVWNPMADRRPALIARCANSADVAAAITFARERELLLAVRSGGHSFPGHSTCDGGMMIDLSNMRDVRVDAAKRLTTVSPGAWVSDVDSKTQSLDLATTMGQISDTGVAGLTLGGGYGWLSRKLGLACDNLISAELVTADGKIRRVSAAAYIAYPHEHMRAVMDLYQETTAKGPRELSLDLSIEASDKGEPQVAIYACHSGDPAEGPALMAPFEKVAKPVQSVREPVPYERVQHQSDGPHLSNNFHYIKAGLVREFKPELIETLKREFKPSGSMFVYMQNASGAVGDVAPEATAFWNRKSMTNLMILGSWKNPADTEANRAAIRAAIRAAWDKIAPFSQGFYTNLSDSEGGVAARNYGGNYPRLAALKQKYDPRNLFRLNSNIQPKS